jgi:hypothetical protein
MMLDDIKILLGAHITLPIDAAIQTAIAMATQHYARYRPNADLTSARATSWIMEYALAYSQLMVGEARAAQDPTHGSVLITIALKLMDNLERELITYV